MFTHREDPGQFLFLLLGKAAMITTPEPFGSHALVSVLLRNQRSVSSSPGSRKGRGGTISISKAAPRKEER